MPTDFKKLFIFLFLLRLLLALAPGYVHPDEFFQSPEISAGNVLNVRNWIPWEYDEAYPCRSIVFPMLTTGLPFLWLRSLQWIADTSGFNVNFMTPLIVFSTTRLAFFIYSFLIDLCIYKICRLNAQDPWRPMLVAASSYVLLVYHTRSFSNTIESILLGFVLWSFFDLVLRGLGKRTLHAHLSRRILLLGALMVVGLFARITMAFFCIPVVLAFCYVIDQRSGLRTIGSWSWRCQNVLYQAIPAVVGALLAGTVCILIDSIYFRSFIILMNGNALTWSDISQLLQDPRLISLSQFSFTGSLVVTPWNNARYNMKTENLNQHGLHPHYLHLLVNMPMLYGPLVWMAYKRIIQKIMKRQLSSRLYFRSVTGYVAILGVLALSIVPHQEARFLLPVIIPLIISLSQHFINRSRSFWTIWIIFNTVGAILFGGLHQAGIIPAIHKIYTNSLANQCESLPLSTSEYPLMYCQHSNNATKTIAKTAIHAKRTKVIFYKTYMPPEHLFLQSNQLNTIHDSTIQLMDLGGGSIDTLLSQLGSHHHLPVITPTMVSISNEPISSYPAIYTFNPTHGHYERTLVVMPSYIHLPPPSTTTQFKLIHISTVFPHLSLDHIDIWMEEPNRFIDGLTLSIYQLSQLR
ncbi:Alg9-like mannosyltransferase family-domain-containing protein [Syncephalis fuscata]|nr:Alg9-like mannosyltransferase family-domain-containing protein [Syncephalis fuscata]